MVCYFVDVIEFIGSKESEGVGVGVVVLEDIDEVDFGEKGGVIGKSEDFGVYIDEKDFGVDSSGLKIFVLLVFVIVRDMSKREILL